MTQTGEITERADGIRGFMGQPVFIQLKVPIIACEVTEVQALPHAKVTTAQWIPTEGHEDSRDPKVLGPLTVTEYIKYAVPRQLFLDHLIFDWLQPGRTGGVWCQSMIRLEDIAAITRIVTQPPLPEEPKLIKLP